MSHLVVVGRNLVGSLADSLLEVFQYLIEAGKVLTLEGVVGERAVVFVTVMQEVAETVQPNPEVQNAGVA